MPRKPFFVAKKRDGVHQDVEITQRVKGVVGKEWKSSRKERAKGIEEIWELRERVQEAVRERMGGWNSMSLVPLGLPGDTKSARRSREGYSELRMIQDDAVAYLVDISPKRHLVIDEYDSYTSRTSCVSASLISGISSSARTAARS
jgi:hypothetical protein